MGEHLVTGPCGEPAGQPRVEVRSVDTADGPMVEIAMLSTAYCWRVRSWWSPAAAAAIARQLLDAAVPSPHDTRTQP